MLGLPEGKPAFAAGYTKKFEGAFHRYKKSTIAEA
jgi:hypothetical protein